MPRPAAARWPARSTECASSSCQLVSHWLKRCRRHAIRLARLRARQKIGPAPLQGVAGAEQTDKRPRNELVERCIEVAALEREPIDDEPHPLGHQSFPGAGLSMQVVANGVFELVIIVQEGWRSHELQRAEAGMTDDVN